MKQILRFAFTLVAILLCAPGSPVAGPAAEKRIALVIGNGSYQAQTLPTAANDAGLIAQTLQAAGFDTVGARDLDEDSLRHAFREFVEKASSSGPDTVAFVYFSGLGLQLEGENYLVPVDAVISRDADIAAKAVRVSDYVRSLSALQPKATLVVLDAARRSPFQLSGQPIAGGLALVEPAPGMLIAFNAAPGTVAPDQDGAYGAYAQALAEMIREGGLSLNEVFERVRLRVNETTQGAEVPWNASKLETSVVFFERAPDAPPPAAPAEQAAAIRAKPIRDLAPQEAYLAAVQRDSLGGYEEFLGAYPSDPMAGRVRAILAARREALTWRRTYITDTPNAYWSYLRRYPHGPHAWDARRRLSELAAATEPPSGFAMVDYDVPPPPPQEAVYIDRPVLAFDDPQFGFVPPPPPPVYVLPPPPPDFVVLPPPPPPAVVFALPVPAFVPIPVWCNPPVYVAAPPNNIIFNNIHNTIVVNQTTNVVTVTNPSGQTISAAPRGVAGGAAPVLGPALPPTVAKKAALIQAAPGAGTPGGQLSNRLPANQALPGSPGQPLPAPNARTGNAPGAPATARLPANQALPTAPGQPLPSANTRPGSVHGAPGTTPPAVGAPATAPANAAHHQNLPAGTNAAVTPGGAPTPAPAPNHNHSSPAGASPPPGTSSPPAANAHKPSSSADAIGHAPGTPAPGTNAAVSPGGSPLPNPTAPNQHPSSPAAAVHNPSSPGTTSTPNGHKPTGQDAVGHAPSTPGPTNAAVSPGGPPPANAAAPNQHPSTPAAAAHNPPLPSGTTPNAHKPPVPANSTGHLPATPTPSHPNGQGKPSSPAAALHAVPPPPALHDTAPAAIQRHTPPPAHNPPPPVAGHPPPPPVAAHAPANTATPALHAPPPPAAAVNRAVSPPTAMRAPPPPAVNRAPPPGAGARPNPPAAAARRSCQVVNGREVCR